MKKLLCLVLALLTAFSVAQGVLADCWYDDDDDWCDDDDCETITYNEYGFPVRGTYEYDEEYREGVKAFKKKDYKSAYNHFRNSALDGYAYGQYEYANCLENEWGCKKNYSKAYEYYFYAAMQGHSTAQAALGRCYLWGRGTDKDYSLAVKYLRLSSEQGDALGQLWLGYCYEKGYGVSKDKAQARYWYNLSADQGNANAKKRLRSL